MSAQYPAQPSVPLSTPSSVKDSHPSFTMKPVKKRGNIIPALVFIVLTLILGYLFKDRILPKPGMITVIGEGKVQAQPEIVRFTVSWIASGNSAQEALSNQKTLYNKLIDILKASGVKEQDIQVTYPRVVAPTTSEAGYQAVNALDAKLSNISKFDQLTASLYDNGAVSIANMALSTDNQKELEEQAIAKAIKDAEDKAEKTAQASKKKLGRLVSLTSDATGEVNAVTSQAGRGNQEQSGFSVPAEGTDGGQALSTGLGKIEVIRKVSVVYEIK